MKYLITFKATDASGAAISSQSIASLVTAAGGTVLEQYTFAPIILADIAKDMVASLNMSSNIKAIEPCNVGDVRLMEVTGASVSAPTKIAASRIPWGITKVRAPELHAKNITGKTVKVGIIDTGGDYKHPDLAATYAGGWDFVNNDADPLDDNSHGCVAPWDRLYTSLCGLQTAECLYEHVPGILHQMDDGAHIKDVSRANIHTISISEDGKPIAAQVRAVHKLHHRGSVYEVKTGDGTLTLTPWHPVYVVSSATGRHNRLKKKRADELRVGERVVVPEPGPDVGRTVRLPYRQRWVCRHCDYEATGGLRQSCRGCGKRQWHDGPVTREIELDHDLAFWLGLVASDGHLNSTQRVVEFTNTNEATGQLFAELSRKLFDGEAKRYQYGTRAAAWKLHNADAHELAGACGIPIGNKSRTIGVPNLITKSPRFVVMAFVAGYIEGNGCVDEGLRIRTGSQTFAEELVVLMHTLGVRASCSTQIDRISNLPNYLVAVSADPDLVRQLQVKDASRLRATKRHRSVGIKSIETKTYDGPMYDLTVDGTHNYVANGHIVSNTHCWGTIAASLTGGVLGIAPDVKVYHYKVLNAAGSGSWDAVVSAYQRALADGCQVTNNSYGGSAGSVALEAAMKAISDAGVIMMCSAGNNGAGADTVGFPAKYPGAIAVGATDSNDAIASFSSRGPKVEISAPGVSVESTIPGGLYGLKSGTSMACPHTVGVVSLALSAGVPAAQIRTRMQLAVDLAPPGRDSNSGFGLIDGMAFVNNEAPPPLIAAYVTFDGSRSADSDGTIVLYSWQFDDNSITDGKIVTKTFNIPGLHTASLTVKDNGGKTATKARVFNVLPKIIPSLHWVATYSPLTKVLPCSVTLDASRTQYPGGTIAEFSWTFHDGEVLLGPIVSKTFTDIGPNNGAFQVTIKLTNTLGESWSNTLVVGPFSEASDPANVPPVADFTANGV